uniref:NADH-ubiquinone oxidoreductase chain 4 n=1 Tax=Lyperosomum longicauda TaxID=2714089 RepID=A0A6H0YBX0_9TREM|nr:NADH dehydrogenase subunit 4 [Lyperosomum longicauda]QIX04652.1 NADH dehydrogenase subunit 4 [Lyperosomum longicauda]
MSFKWFDWYSGLIGFFMALISLILGFVCSNPVDTYYCGLSISSPWFCFDLVSFYLVILILLLAVSLLFHVHKFSFIGLSMLSLSIVCSVLCCCCVHSFWFWCLYEMSILPLLLLLVLESPYSERYVASWYFLGYVVLSSLPMLLCLVYLSMYFGSFNFGCWSIFVVGLPISVRIVMVVLSVLFIVKVPLPPFHAWLPLVHAEATSSVSICLSGYIMKLGILGLCRICSPVLTEWVFTFEYLMFCLGASFFFFLGACFESDSKRWLALMSLSHILVACACLGVSEPGDVGLALLYCLGHGLSAGVMFTYLSVGYELVGSRNWLMLKSVCYGKYFNGVFVACLCTVMSLPPTVQFFCEVYVLFKVAQVSGFLLFFLAVYLFLSGLVPLILIGGLGTRHVVCRCVSEGVVYPFFSSVFLLIWCFALFLVF